MTATTDGGDLLLAGAIISAQTTTESTENQIVTASSTVTDESGEYVLLAAPGTYQVVAVMPNYATAAATVTVAAGDMVEQNFVMTPVEGVGTIYGTVSILKAADNQSVTINILKNQDDGTLVEVTSKSVANGGTYYFDLSPGTYSMTALFDVNGEQMTLEAKDAFEILDGTVIEFDILFENTEDQQDTADDGNTDGTDSQKPEKVTICHKGRTITISSSALRAHLNHGDTEGACDSGAGDDSDETDGDDAEPDTDEEDGAEQEGEGEELETDTDTEQLQKVTICHKGRQISVSEAALQAHLNHGDTLGECADDD